MDALILTIAEHRKLKPASINTYRANLIAMDYFNHTPAEHIDNIKNCGFSDSTKRARYTALLVALNPKNIQWAASKNPKDADNFPDELNEHKAEILAARQDLWDMGNKYKKNAKIKNEKEKEKWITWKQVLKNRNKLRNKMIKQYGWKMSDSPKKWFEGMKERNGKILPGEQRDLEKWVLANLYTYLPPRRNDYNNLRWCKEKNLSKTDPCIIVKSHNRGYLPKPKQIYFPAVACKSDQGDCYIDIPKKLQKVLSWYLFTQVYERNNSKKPPVFAISYKMWDRTKNNFGRILKDALGVGSQMLRKIYLTSQYAETAKKQEKDAKLMNHSLTTQKTSYIKMS